MAAHWLLTDSTWSIRGSSEGTTRRFFLYCCPGSGRLMTRVVCAQLSALRRGSSLGKGDCEQYGGLRVRGQLRWLQLEQRKHERCRNRFRCSLIASLQSCWRLSPHSSVWMRKVIKWRKYDILFNSCVMLAVCSVKLFRAFFNVGRGVDSWMCRRDL